MYVHGSEERLIKAAREDKLDSLEAAHVLKKVKKRRDCNIGRRKLYMVSILDKPKT